MTRYPMIGHTAGGTIPRTRAAPIVWIGTVAGLELSGVRLSAWLCGIYLNYFAVGVRRGNWLPILLHSF